MDTNFSQTVVRPGKSPVIVRHNTTRLDIRHYFVDNAGALQSTEKGVNAAVSEINALIDAITAVSEKKSLYEIVNVSTDRPIHIYISLFNGYEMLHIRHYVYVRSRSKTIPTKAGVCIHANEWRILVQSLRKFTTKG